MISCGTGLLANGTNRQNLLFDWDAVLAVAVGDAWFKEINDMVRVWVSAVNLEGYTNPGHIMRKKEQG